MVRVLIGLRNTVARNQLARGSAAAAWIGLVVGVATAAGTLVLGFVHGPQVDGSLDRISAVLALWLAGQVALRALNGGDTALRPELLALLPLNRRRLAWALLVVGLCDPVLLLVGVAYAALIAVAAGLGAAAIVAAALGVIGLLVLTSVAASVAGGLLGPGARRGRDLGTIVVALALSGLAVASTLLPVVLSGLQRGRWPVLTGLVRVLPSGWPGDAISAAHYGHWPLAVVALAGPFVLTAVIAACWPAILGRRMTLTTSSSRPEHRSGPWLLRPRTPRGAVAAKELRLWLRDPVRITCLLVALIVGIGVALIPRLTEGTSVLLPFGGPFTVLIAGACACDLYAGDGSSLWLTVMTPGSAAPDVRGRQLAWALLVGPLAVAETVILTAWAGRASLWPWAIGLLVALIGGSVGLIPLASLISVQPRDEAGNPTPGFSLKVHIALVVFALSAAPAAVLLALGAASHIPALSWLGVAVATLTGAASVLLLGRAAVRRLRTHQAGILHELSV
jgi:ABC-2 type transport system permease protein